MPGLNTNTVVEVDVFISPVAAAVRNFGSLMILGTTTTVIDTNERLRFYDDIADIQADFGSNPEYLAAQEYLSQSPPPAGVYIGRWARTDTSAVLHCGVLTPSQQAPGNFTTITNGGFQVTVDGTAKSLTGLNFSAAVDLNGVAAIITTGFSGAATCVWDARLGRFNIASSTTGTASTITYLTGPVSGTDISGRIKGTSSTASPPVNGIAGESITAAFSILTDMSSDWYGILPTAVTSIADQTYISLANAVEAASPSRICGITTQNTQALDSTVTNDLASTLKGLGLKRTFIQYSGTNPYAAAAIFGGQFTIDFNGENTTDTVKFKVEAGVIPETILASQARALQAKNCNVFVNYNNGTAIVQEGVMCGGQFFDETHGLDWLQNDVQTAVWNELYGEKKVPQTDPGVHGLLTTCEDRMLQAGRNGLVGPGQWNGPKIGALNTGDYLAKGFYGYAAPVATQAQADRDRRAAPPIQLAAKLAGAVHFANVLINVNR